MRRSTHLTSGSASRRNLASTQPKIRPAGRTRQTGLGQSGLEEGAPLIDNNELTLSVLGVQRNPDGSGIMRIQAHTASTVGVCWAAFIGLVDQNNNLLGQVSLGQGPGTCFYKKNLHFDPPTTEQVRFFFWWDQDSIWDTAFGGEFGDTPTFKDQITFGEDPPRYKSQWFPLVTTQEGREQGLYTEEDPTIGEFIAGAAPGVGSTLREVAIWTAVLGLGGAALWYGGPLIAAGAEQASRFIEPAEEAATDDAGREDSASEDEDSDETTTESFEPTQ